MTWILCLFDGLLNVHFVFWLFLGLDFDWQSGLDFDV